MPTTRSHLCVVCGMCVCVWSILCSVGTKWKPNKGGFTTLELICNNVCGFCNNTGLGDCKLSLSVHVDVEDGIPGFLFAPVVCVIEWFIPFSPAI